MTEVPLICYDNVHCMRLPSITAEKFFDKAHRIACLYGFMPADKVLKKYRHIKRIKVSPYNKSGDKYLRHLSTLLGFCFERSLHLGEHEPLFLFHSNIDEKTKSSVTTSKKSDNVYFTLTVIGINKPYAEALILSCTNHIFRAFKSEDHLIRINSMGTAEDSKVYFSKLAKTLRRMRKQMQPDCEKLFSEGRLCEAHTLLHNSEHAGIAEYITPTLRLLSEKARHHFEQVIEYLEAHQLPYELAPDIVELTRHGIHTAFEINNEESPLYARGARYDTLPFHIYRRKVPTVAITITLPEKTDGLHRLKTQPRKPKIFFFHVGEKAQLQSLHIISKLYDANIPVAHRLHYTRVADQLNDEARSYPYTIVFGQEEAENNVLCIRRTDTRASRVVEINEEALQSIKDFLRQW